MSVALAKRVTAIFLFVAKLKDKTVSNFFKSIAHGDFL